MMWIILILVGAAGAAAFYFHDTLMGWFSKAYKETMEEIEEWKATLESEYEEKMAQLEALKERLDEKFDEGISKLSDELQEELDDIKEDIEEAEHKLVDLI